MKYIKIIILISVAISILFVTYVVNNDKTKIKIPNNKILPLLILKLEKEKLPFKISNNNIFEINKTDKDKFSKLYGETHNTLMPPERTFGSLSKIQPYIEKALKEKGYNFNKICFRNKEYIILEKHNYKEVEKLVNKVTEEVIYKLSIDAPQEDIKKNLGEFKKCNQNS